MINRKFLGALVTGLGVLVGLQTGVHADVADYEVHALIPSTQIVGNHTEAFDMVLAPGQQQEMTFVITNHTDKDIVFDISKGTAKTTVKGAVNYTAINTTFDASLPEQIGEDMQIPSTVTAKANTDTDFNVELTAPAKAWSGLLAGGIKIAPRGDVAVKKVDQTDRQGITTVDKTIGVFIRNQETLPTAKPQFESAKLEMINKKPAFGVVIRKPNGNFVNTMRLTSEVVDKSGKIVLYDDRMGLTMAPYSNMTWPINLKKEGLPSGKYTVKVTARWIRDSATGDYVDKVSDKREYVKHWQTKVNVKANETTVKQHKTWSWLDTLLAIVVAIFVIGIIVLLVKFAGLKKYR